MQKAKAESLYGRLSHHVMQQEASKEQFCPSNPLFLNSEELRECFGNIGLPITLDDAKAIMVDHDSLEADYLNMEHFFRRLTVWKIEDAAVIAPVKK